MKKILNFIGIDTAIGFTLIARILQAFGGLFNLFLISLFLTKEQQGYYYTFGSLIAIQIFFELGLGTIIIQFVAHEAAHINFNSEYECQGKTENISRLSSLLHFCIKVYSSLSVLLFLVLNIVGFIFFSHYKSSSNTIDWQSPWIMLCFSSSLMLAIDPIMGFLQGLGKVNEVAKVSVIQQTATMITTATILYFRGGLWALGLANFVSVFVLITFIFFTNRFKLLKSIYKIKHTAIIDYKSEIFPYQYKIALSWISGYFIFQLFNPVLFATEGAEIAGRMGMTITVLSGISGLSMSWITTKVPKFSAYIATREFKKLDVLFSKTVYNLLFVCFFLISIFISLIVILKIFKIPMYLRFLPIQYVLMLSVVTLVNQLIFSWATYLRCHKQEPFMLNSIVGGILTAISTLVLGHYFGILGILSGYTFLTCFIGLPWAYRIYVIKKKEWHNG